MGNVRTTISALTAVSPRITRQARSAIAGGPLRIYQPWRSGPADGAPGPHLISVNEYRPHRLADLAPIGRLSAALTEQLLAMEDAFGIVTSYQPAGRVTYSLSVWTSEEALRSFTLSPSHRRVMSEYRARGYLRHIHWWGEFTNPGTSAAEATRKLDAGEGRRVGDPRGRWGARDRDLLAHLGREGGGVHAAHA